MLGLALLIPIICFFSLSGFGRYLGRSGASILAVSSLGFCLLVFSYYGFSKVWEGSCTVVNLSMWVGYTFEFGFIFDSISLEMCLLISSITFCILLYSTEYMFHDPFLIRFLSFLILFSFFMLILVTSHNFFQMFIGWEGVGLVSFLLINFWFMRLEANRAAIKAIIFNRVGDSFYLLGTFFLLNYYHTTDVILITNLVQSSWHFPILIISSFSISTVDCIIFCFFLAAVGKSAQLFLHAWLPDAMEGPTPVSSLLHSATMVTAGVFLLIRISPLFSLCTFGYVFIFIGAITALINGLYGLLQNDLKKIIAFSTCSQLGLMIVAVFYNPTNSLYHLINHGYFKALLFLSAGSIIHGLYGEQDIRKMGGLWRYFPFTFICMLIGSLALSGFPFLSGFYSKELLLFYNFSFGTWLDFVIFCFMILTSMFTVLYSLKILFYVFFSKSSKVSKSKYLYIHETPMAMLSAMTVLTIFAIFYGFLNEELFNNSGHLALSRILSHSPQRLNMFFSTELSFFTLKWFLLFFFLLMFGVKLRFVINNYLIKFWLMQNFSQLLVFCFWSLANRFGFISFYKLCVQSFFYIAYRVIILILDRGLFEVFGPTVIVRIFTGSKATMFNLQMIIFDNIFVLFSLFFLFLICLMHIKLCIFLFLFLFFLFILF